jgi:hypothetical protein
VGSHGQPVTIGFTTSSTPSRATTTARGSLDLDQTWIPLATFTGKIPNGSACDTFAVVLPDTIRAKFDPAFRSPSDSRSSDVGYSSADVSDDGWVIDSISSRGPTSDSSTTEQRPGQLVHLDLQAWATTTRFSRTHFTEDICRNASVWSAFDP